MSTLLSAATFRQRSVPMRANLVSLDFIVGIGIGLSAVIGPAAAVQGDSGGYNNHCFQYLSDGPCFIPNPNPPASTSCFDLNLELVLKNHVENKNSTPANAYWELADATFLGDVFTYHVNKKVALCHTGPLPTGRYYSTCRETVRDNDWDDAKYQPSCSIFHDNDKPLRGSGCVVLQPQASDKGLSRLDIALAVATFIVAPPACIQYYKDGRRFWRYMHAQPGDLEPGEAPNRRL